MAWKRRRRWRQPTIWRPSAFGLEAADSPLSLEPLDQLEDQGIGALRTWATPPLELQLWKNDDGQVHNLADDETTDNFAKVLRAVGWWRPVQVVAWDGQAAGACWTAEVRYALARLATREDDSPLRSRGTPPASPMDQPDLFGATGLGYEDLVHLRSWRVFDCGINFQVAPAADDFGNAAALQANDYFGDVSASYVDCKVNRRTRDSTRVCLLRQVRVLEPGGLSPDEENFLVCEDFMRVLFTRPRV